MRLSILPKGNMQPDVLERRLNDLHTRLDKPNLPWKLTLHEDIELAFLTNATLLYSGAVRYSIF
jgi:hypothetical protein